MGKHREITIALDGEIRERLEATAKKEERSLGDEIRRRVERTIEQDKIVNPGELPRIESEALVSHYIQTAILAAFRHEDLYDWDTRALGETIMSLARDVYRAPARQPRQGPSMWGAHPPWPALQAGSREGPSAVPNAWRGKGLRWLSRRSQRQLQTRDLASRELGDAPCGAGQNL